MGEPKLPPPGTPPLMVSTPAELEKLIARCSDAEALAVDLEANGFHAYMAKLCAIQIAWHEGDDTLIAIVDPLAFDARPIGRLFDSSGPTKVLHDLSFDARLLAQADIPLGNVRDTAVCARFLGENATGLASLLKARFDIEMSKALQRHDWASRPFTEKHIGYLAGDVAYLLDLDKLLFLEAAVKGISEEVQLETDHRLMTAARTNTPAKPPHSRIKGYGKLSLEQQGILRQLVLTRDSLAERADIPLGNICPNALLLELARRQPQNARSIRSLCGRRRGAARHASSWLNAISRGTQDGPPPKEEQALLAPKSIPREERSARKSIESRLQGWRKKASKDRDVDQQVVLPGHCVPPTVTALYTSGHDIDEFRDALAQVSGFGACRIERYAQSLFSLATTQEATRPPTQ